MDLLKTFQQFSTTAGQTVDSINEALPKLMEHLSPDQKKELEDTLKKADWGSVKDQLAKANEMISKIPV